MPLASWLDAHWNHKRLAEGYSTVVNAAKALDEQVWQRHQFKLLYLNDPVKFRDLSEKEVERSPSRTHHPEEYPDYDPPQYGTHADPSCRGMDKETFFALIGCVPNSRPLQVITMNTAAKYEAVTPVSVLADVFVSRRLWSDHPSRDCADLDVSIAGAPDGFYAPLPAVHLGTAWTHPWRRDKGIMGLVSRLHRLVAYIRFGALPQFGTVVPDRRHPFKGREIGTVVETRDGLSKESKVLFYSAESLVEDAQSVLAETDKTSCVGN